MDFSLSSFLGHLDKEQVSEPTRDDNQKVISNDVSIILILKVVFSSILLIFMNIFSHNTKRSITTLITK